MPFVLKCRQERCACYSHELSGNPKIDPDCQWMDWCNKIHAQPGYNGNKCPVDDTLIYYKIDEPIEQYYNPKLPKGCPDCKRCHVQKAIGRRKKKIISVPKKGD